MKYQIRFFRYFSNGSLNFTYEIPDEYIEKYKDFEKSSTIRFRVSALRNGIGDPKHIITQLFNDAGFIESIRNLRGADVPVKLYRSMRHPGTNFFVNFINPDEPTKMKASKTPTDPVEKKVKKEKKVIQDGETMFKAEKQKALKRINYIQTMQTFPDNTRNDTIRGDNEEKYKKILKDIFISWKSMLENTLTAMNVPFEIVEKEEDIPSYGVNLAFSYFLGKNTENFSKKIMSRIKSNIGLLNIAWYSTNHTPAGANRWNRQRVLMTKKIGVCSALRRGYVRGLKSMRFSTFKAMVQEIQMNHDTHYQSKIEAMKAMAAREPDNKVKLEKLKNYINKKIIPAVNPSYLSNVQLDDLDKEHFGIVMTDQSSRWSTTFTLLEIGAAVDSNETLNYSLKFFNGRKNFVTEDIDKVILALEDAFGVNLPVIVDACVKINLLN